MNACALACAARCWALGRAGRCPGAAVGCVCVLAAGVGVGACGQWHLSPGAHRLVGEGPGPEASELEGDPNSTAGTRVQTTATVIVPQGERSLPPARDISVNQEGLREPQGPQP